MQTEKLLLLQTDRIIRWMQMETFYPAAMRSVMSAASLYRQRENGVVISRDLKKSWQMPSTATPKNLYTPMQTVRNTPTPSLTKPDSKTWSVLQSKETYMYDRYAGPPKPTGSAPIQTVWIC